MTQTVSQIMTPNPVILDAEATVTDAARKMRERDVGDVLVQRDGTLCGILTDRDLVVRCVADGQDPSAQALERFCSQELATLDVQATVDEAIDLMRRRAVRRVPILNAGSPVGIVSIGDLARERDPQSALGQISAASASH